MTHLQENTLFDIWPWSQGQTFDHGVKVTRNVTQYPLHHVISASTRFEITTFNGYTGGKPRNYHEIVLT